MPLELVSVFLIGLFFYTFLAEVSMYYILNYLADEFNGFPPT